MSTTMHELTTDSADATRAVAERIGRRCRGGEVICLEGSLGAGKTCFTQGLARGLDVPPALPVTSPTFVLHAVYPGRLELHHLDGYRLRDAPDAAALGFDEAFEAPGTVAAVEWPAFLDAILPPRRLVIHFEPLEGDRRRLCFAVPHPDDEKHAELIDGM